MHSLNDDLINLPYYAGYVQPIDEDERFWSCRTLSTMTSRDSLYRDLFNLIALAAGQGSALDQEDPVALQQQRSRSVLKLTGI